MVQIKFFPAFYGKLLQVIECGVTRREVCRVEEDFTGERVGEQRQGGWLRGCGLKMTVAWSEVVIVGMVKWSYFIIYFESRTSRIYWVGQKICLVFSIRWL